LLILDLWGISFHAVIVFGLGKNILFKSVLGHCEYLGSLDETFFLLLAVKMFVCRFNCKGPWPQRPKLHERPVPR
jgi:hypothetical protein